MGVADDVPEPLSGTDWLPPPALSVKVSAAVRLPVSTGESATMTVQLAVGASTKLVPMQDPPGTITKSSGFVPVKETSETFSGPVPLLAMVTVCGALVVKVCWLVNPRPAAGVR